MLKSGKRKRAGRGMIIKDTLGLAILSTIIGRLSSSQTEALL